MGILARELMNHVIQPALERFSGFDSALAQLLIGTAAQESQLGNWLKQEQGPALGIWQMEPFTHDDIHKTFLAFRPELRKKLYLASDMKNYGAQTPPAYLLCTNLIYSCLMARIRYMRVRARIPPFNDITAQANYWKANYNTKAGKGDVSGYLLNYERFLRKYYENNRSLTI